MLHTNTTLKSASAPGNLQAVPSLFLSLPQEVHFKIGAFLDPQALSNIVQTCCQCKEDYDTDVNFIPFLKPEYQKQVPKQLSKGMFSFEVRKRHNITFEHSNQFSNGRSLQYLFLKNIIDQKSIPFYSESELINFCYRFQEPNICKLIESNLLSIEEVKNLTNKQVENLGRMLTYRLFTKNKISLEDLDNFTDTHFKRLSQHTILQLFLNDQLSLKDIECLTDDQLFRLLTCEIYLLFRNDKLSLETIDSLTSDQYEKLRLPSIAKWIENNTLSLEDLENISVNQAQEMGKTFFFLFINSLISLEWINTLTKDQIYRLRQPNIRKLLIKKRLSFDDFKSLSNKQVDRLSNHNIYWLFKKRVLCLQAIENLSSEATIDLSKRNFLNLMAISSTSYWNSLWANLRNQPRKKM